MAATPAGAAALQSSGELKNDVIMNSDMLQSCVLEKVGEKDVKDELSGIITHCQQGLLKYLLISLDGNSFFPISKSFTSLDASFFSFILYFIGLGFQKFPVCL